MNTTARYYRVLALTLLLTSLFMAPMHAAGQTNSAAGTPGFAGASVLPAALPADGVSQALIKARVSDPQGAGDIVSVQVDASALGAGTLTLRDDGRSGDGPAGDGTYGAALRVTPGTPIGEYTLVATAVDSAGLSASFPVGAFVVLAAPGGTIPAGLPARLGWGTSEWLDAQGNNWQNDSGVPWDYHYRYITYEWYTDPGHWGNYVQQVSNNAWSNNYVPVITVYNMLAVGGNRGEGALTYAAKLANPTTVNDYLASLQKAAEDARGSKPVILHLEPDFTGFMQHLSNDPANRLPGVRANDPSSFPVALNLPGYSNTLAGFGQRMIDVVRQTAPNALVALHASPWATNGDPNQGTPEDTIAMAQRTAAFLKQMGGDNADLLVVEWSDRDAGSGQRPFWDDTNRSLPRYPRATLWQSALSAAAGKRLLLWQVPAGNMSLDNTPQHYKDNRSAYAFSHPLDLLGAGIIGVMYGAGDGNQTTPATDGGFIAAQGAIAYSAPGLTSGLELVALNGPVATFAWDENAAPDIAGYRLSYRAPDGSSKHVTTGPLNSASLLFSSTGAYQVTVAAIDAMGNIGPTSSPIEVTTDADANLSFLPLLVR